MAELDALQKIYPQVLKHGGKLVIFSPQLPENSRKMAEENGYTFPLVHDKDLILSNELRLTHGFPKELSDLYAKFGLDIPKANGTDAWELPMPARYLVDNSGRIRDSAINPDYTKRPEPSDMLGLLATLF